MIEAAMFYTNALIWLIGALLLIVLLGHAVQFLAWRLYRDVVGWPTIGKALRMYHAAQAKKED